ncbi:MAG: AbrB/MazE/SpoVT family DNA-binding domain-containing protein [Bryobacteraceae bacterium]|jgi:AbrB family looped-hinge helix DNA binding protein
MPFYNGSVRNKVRLDRAGRVLLPQALRDDLHLSVGDTFELMVQGDEVILRPKRAVSPLEKERGVWVFHTGKRLTSAESEEALRRIRDERQRQNSHEGE